MKRPTCSNVAVNGLAFLHLTFDLLTMIQLRFVPGAVTVAAAGTQVRLIGGILMEPRVAEVS